MWRGPSFRIVLGIALLGLCWSVGHGATVDAGHNISDRIQRGESFLTNLFDARFHLLPEYRGSSTYWLFHDNYLAAHLLARTRPDLSRQIRSTLEKFGVTKSGKIEIVFGEAVEPLPFRTYVLTNVASLDGKSVRTELVTTNLLAGWEEYADLLLLASLAQARSAEAEARRDFERTVAMWDGQGFADRATKHSGLYATYKLALYLIAAHRLNISPPHASEVVARLLAMQSPEGGWITDYRDDRPVGLANVETTCLSLLALQTLGPAQEITSAVRPKLPEPPDGIAQFFEPPQKYRSDLGGFHSPLLFADGTPVRTPTDWQRRRAEILATWHDAMGPWPPLIERPRVEFVNTTRRENITQQQVRIEIALENQLVDALLLVPAPEAPVRKRPAVLVTYYDAETGVGLGAPMRDYGWQLAKRGFVTLSIGKPHAQIDLTTTNKPRTDPYLGPIGKPVRVQPLSALAYAAANAQTVLAQRADVQPDRIGIVGHSFGGKWAMFASCLYDKFAAAVWSDPGIVFDERDRRQQNPSGSVNYWDVWYLGFDLGAIADPQNAGTWRKLPSEGQPRTGAYKALVEGGHDLVELHALMAPRPFLVSGGTADLPERWPALNHALAVNKLLGFDRRVALTAREGHTPTAEANEQVYRFFEWCLRPPN
ncbi:MAG TPA: hypothetical protein VJA21_15875 [Verrucomicrobiae bacterium]